MPEAALEQARRREEAIGRGDYRGPLDGVPVGIKDNIALAGVPCTAGSLVFADYVPTEDSFAVQQYRQAGAVVLGKENMHELAAGGTSDNPHFGTVRNPWNTDHIPAGSSGGAAANVAACITFASLGTDIGGSVRTPAAYCGIVGVKPTFGRVSQRGLVATTFHGDHIGPLGPLRRRRRSGAAGPGRPRSARPCQHPHARARLLCRLGPGRIARASPWACLRRLLLRRR